jgi:hypothetical protein
MDGKLAKLKSQLKKEQISLKLFQDRIISHRESIKNSEDIIGISGNDTKTIKDQSDAIHIYKTCITVLEESITNSQDIISDLEREIAYLESKGKPSGESSEAVEKCLE